MADRESMGTNIDQGVIARVTAGVKYMISGVTPQSWFGPQQPMAPQAQEKTQGRGWDYPVGVNLRIQPRSTENISFYQLRALADSYDLMRLVIETRKDQIESFKFEIVPKDPEANADSLKDKINEVKTFLEYPDKEHNWSEWMRLIIEDLLVIDAVCIYPRMNRGGKLYGLELVDGATIKRLIDDTGRTPMPPDPAYQSILKGIVAADYSRNELFYMMRNPRTWKMYGYSPVEQVITTVNIALRRQMSQLEYYTAGNMPEAIAQLPQDWPMAQVKEFQTWWDSMMEGNTANRRKMKFIPNIEGILFPKAELIKDEYDEWLARIVCFAFSISPTAFIKMVNRASGEQMADTAKEEGLFPLLTWFESKMDFIIARHIGCPDLAFRWKINNKVAPKEQADIHGVYIDKKVMTPDEVREELGMDAMSDEDRAKAFPEPIAPPVMGGDGSQANDSPSKVSPPAPKSEPNADNPAPTDAEKMVKVDVHLGDTFVRVMPAEAPITNVHVAGAEPAQITVNTPEVTVNPADVIIEPVNITLGDVHVQTDLRQPASKSTKTIRAERQPDGSMLAKVETTESVSSSFRAEMAEDGSILTKQLK